MTVHGIGQSRSTWGKVSDITLGADAWQVRFDDLLFTDDAETLDDAILGSTFLENFIVTIDFGHLRFVLERPEEFDEELMASPAIKKRD